MAFKMKGSSYKMGGHKTKATMAYMKSPLEQAKPDYPDIDGDGNTKESMKQAAADKKSPMEMSSPMLQMIDRRKEYKGGSIYNYFEEPTQDNIDDMLGYAGFLETTAAPGAKEKAARIRQHAADDLRTMESDKSAREDSDAENRRLIAEGETGPQG